MGLDELIETDKKRRADAKAAAQALRMARYILSVRMVVVAILISYLDMLTSVGVGVEYLETGYTTLGWTVIGIQVPGSRLGYG